MTSKQAWEILNILKKHASIESESPGIEDIKISVIMESEDYAKIRKWLDSKEELKK